MSNSEIYICPGMGGYKFRPSIPQYEARLLSFLQPSPEEIQDSDPFVPMFRADWLREMKFIPFPRSKVVIFVGLRATALKSEIHRGGGSVWGVARVISVPTTPTWNELVDPIDSLAKNLVHALSGANNEIIFSNDSHLEVISSINGDSLSRAYSRLRNFRQCGLTVGPFQRKA